MVPKEILRVLTCIKNNELEYWLSSEFAGGQLDIGDQEELKGAVRASLRRRMKLILAFIMEQSKA